MKSDWKSVFSDTSSSYFLACSGGVDSMVLAFLMKKAKLSFEILHVNFQLRGKESDLDEQLVIDFSAENEIPVHVKHFDTPKKYENGGNLEQICRDLRYGWFQTFLDKNENSKLVLAHHQDDLLETFYLQLARSSGMVGLASLRPIRGAYLRPLLNYTKTEIYAFARIHAIPWREDKSNIENNFRRNKLRNTFLPFVERNIPDWRNSVLALTACFQENLQRMEKEVKQELSISDSFTIPVDQFELYSTDKKNVFLQFLNLRFSVLSEMEKMKDSISGKYIQSDGWQISKQQDVFIFDKIGEKNLPTLMSEYVYQLPKTFNKQEIYLDPQKIKGCLRIRAWKEGDRFSGIGMKGSKRISKILNELHLSSFQKKKVCVVEDDETIYWIVGMKISKAVASSESKEILKVWIESQ